MGKAVEVKPSGGCGAKPFLICPDLMLLPISHPLDGLQLQLPSFTLFLPTSDPLAEQIRQGKKAGARNIPLAQHTGLSTEEVCTPVSLMPACPLKVPTTCHPSAASAVRSPCTYLQCDIPAH